MDYRKLAEQFMIDTFCKEPPFTPPEDMSKGEVGILTYLTFFHNNILSGELSKGLNITSGRIAIALKSLEKKGFIKRSHGKEDRREVVVCATKSGMEHAQLQKEKGLNDLTRILNYIGEEDSKELIRILYKIFNIK
jgi:DNA-binding MarR family transcriptional regulator